jgi:hypothetical protein
VNARKARERKQLQLNEIRQTLAESQAATPHLVGNVAGQECWVVGKVMHIVPILKDDYPIELKAAIDRRRRAAMTGRCDCGARWEVRRRGHVDMAHEDGCPAADAVLFAIGERYGYHFSRWAA